MPADNTHFNTSNKTSANPLPSQDQYRQELRQRVRDFIRYLLEVTMQEEMTTFLQAEFGEQGNAARQGQRNGYYTRSLFTAMGKVKDLQVPRDRAGLFQTEVFGRYNRYEPEVEEAVEAMYVAGVSQKKVATVTEKLMGARPDPRRVAKMTAGLAERFEQWRKAQLQSHYRVIYLDGVYYPVVYEDKADQTAVLVALGVDQSGNKEVLAIFDGAEESKTAWLSLLRDLKARGVEHSDLFVTDGGDGLIAALKESYPSSRRQRCITHKMRNVLGHVPHRKKKEVAAALKGIFAAESRGKALEEKETFEIRYGTVYPAAIRSLQEDFEACLTYYDFAEVLRRYIRTTNALEGLFSNIRLRTNSIKVFQNEESRLKMVWAASQTIKLQKIPVE